MAYKALAKICLAISGFSIVYMFLIAYEGTNFGWTIFFVFLAFAILFNALDEKEEEIKTSCLPEKEKAEEVGEPSSSPKRLLIPLSLSAEDAFAAVKAHLLDNPANLQNIHEIPQGLYKCEECGEYKGKVMEKDLNWEERYSKDEAGKSEERLTVHCLCEGILCPKCKKNKIHRPISNSYDPETNQVWHHPYFAGMKSCSECQNNKTVERDLPILYPQEIQRMLKMRRIFEQKNELERAKHEHLWSPAIIPPSTATRNNRETEVCFECGQIGR